MAATAPCVLCGKPIRKPLFVIRESRFWRCPECGLVQMNPIPEWSAPGEDYSGFDLATYKTFMASFRIPQYERDLASLKKHAPGGRLLDIGCGLGEFLDVAARHGFRVFGIEPSRTAYENARARHLVLRGELKDVRFKEGAFDAVTLWSVLEHIPFPADFLGRVRSILKPGGHLALRVPDIRGLLPVLALRTYALSFHRLEAPLRVLYQLDWHYKHYYGFDRRTIPRMLDSVGFDVVEIRSDNSYNHRSLGLRMDYLPVHGAGRMAARLGLGVVLVASTLLGKKDELVLVARRRG
jgi:2-polyprenyl-3-methyl-5-hydroxy-6-metoxy-1,4-benzoquinol methylase